MSGGEPPAIYNLHKIGAKLLANQIREKKSPGDRKEKPSGKAWEAENDWKTDLKGGYEERRAP